MCLWYEFIVLWPIITRSIDVIDDDNDDGADDDGGIDAHESLFIICTHYDYRNRVANNCTTACNTRKHKVSTLLVDNWNIDSE